MSAQPPGADQTQLPPQDLTSERAVLGACMLGGDISAVREILYPEDFYLPQHGWIFDAICALHDDAARVDAILVRDRMAQLRTLPQLIRATGNTYLHTLITSEVTPTTANVTTYATNVREAARKRLIATLSVKAHQVANNGVSADEAFSILTEAISEAADRGRFAPRGRGGRALRVKLASSFSMRAPRWLADGTIPLESITLLAGREGIGKSTLAYDTAARLTVGKLDGHHLGKPKSVVVYAAEDSWESVIVPRLVAAGANLERVIHVEAVDDKNRGTPLSVPHDLLGLEAVCEEHDVALLLLDPLMSLIGASIDTHKDRQVREALDPLSAFARSCGVAVLGLIHANKSTTTDPLNAIMGSRAFSAVARSVLYAITDPEEGEPGRYLLCHAKCNLGPTRPSERYRIVTATIPVAGQEGISSSRISWQGQDERSASEVMEAARGVESVPHAAREAADWLRAYLFALPEMTGTSQEVKEAAQLAGHSESTLKRAIRLAGIRVSQQGFPRRTQWTLPESNTGESGEA